jgi:peptide subunit release factor 1 (eRF1)
LSAPRPSGCCIGSWRVEQPEQSLYELEPGQWRDYDAYVGYPGRTPAGMHVATFDQRIEEWRQRFLTEAAVAIGLRVTEFGWHRVLLAGDKPVIDGFADRLPDTVRERVIDVINANVLWEEPAAVADRFENALDEAWRRDTHKIINRAIEAAFEGGKGALGWTEVLDSLVQHRVEHLVLAIDATTDPETLPPHVSDALGKPSAGMVVERAVEHAVASGAAVTAMPDDAERLLSVGGVVATLRY